MNAEKLLPQFDRAAIETPIGFFKTLFRLHEIGRECVIPAIVEEYDSASGIVKVRPLAKSVSQDAEGKEILADRPLYSVHAVRSMHGGVIVESTLYKGDTGWLIASDRNCKDAIAENSTILEGDQSDDEPQNKGASRPTDNSLASFAWGFFIPDSWAGNEPQGEGIGIIDKLKRFGIRITRGFAKLFGVGGSVTIGEDGIDIDGTTSFNGDAIFKGRTIFGDTELGVKKMTFGKGKEPVYFLATDDVECGAGDGTLTIKQGSTILGTFKANQSTDQEITIPQGGGDVTVKGTDENTYTGNSFTLKSASNSNVTATVDSSGNLTIGVYYV